MPPPQDRECHGLLARGVERASESRPAGSLSTVGEGRHGADREAGGMAGSEVSQCGGQLAGRFGGDVHRESFGVVANPFSLPGLDQRDREPAQRSPPADTKDLPLARRQDGAALGRRSTAHDRTELSKDYGLPGSVDAEGSLRWKSNFVLRTFLATISPQESLVPTYLFTCNILCSRRLRRYSESVSREI